ncbi:MAG: hypothetical protein AB2A00_42535 [Myxococcota bacterium]
MKLALISVGMLAVGLALMGWTYASVGTPWGFRHASAVVQGTVGGVEIHQGVGGAIMPTPGMELPPGTQVRTSNYAEARVGMPRADVVVEDRAAVTFGSPGSDILLELGRARLVTSTQEPPLKVAARGNDVLLQLGPGRFVVGTDGKGLLTAVVMAGRLFVQEGTALPEAVAEQRLVVSVPGVPVIVSELTDEVPLSATILPPGGERVLPTVEGRVPPGARAYVNGEVTYPDGTGRFSLQLPPGDEPVVVVAEDILGNTTRMVLRRPGAEE